MDDAEAVERVRAGDVEAYRVLVEKHWRGVLAVLRQRLGNSADVEDLLQETFVRAYERLGQLREPGKFRLWLLRIATKLCADLRRRRREVVPGDESLRLLVERQPSRNAQPSPDTHVLDAVEALPQKYREVVMLRFLGGMTCKEIAEFLDEPAGTVRNRLFRALEMLRSRLRPL